MCPGEDGLELEKTKVDELERWSMSRAEDISLSSLFVMSMSS